MCLEVWVKGARDVLSGGAHQSLHETRGASHLSGGRSHFMPPVPVGGIPRLTLTRGMTTIIVVRTQHAEPARVVDAGSARIDATYNARDHDDL